MDSKIQLGSMLEIFRLTQQPPEVFGLLLVTAFTLVALFFFILFIVEFYARAKGFKSLEISLQ